ncbi:CBO0543 family protein [Halalkalibacter lacteus]|uniref:CBO0543 family protein n=1 Tax=Halalkalibacter lacteus TaxID=3090663 RepID=UPI002FC920AC
MKQQEFIENINKLQTKVNQMTDEYWIQFSDLSTWQFWYHLAWVIIPLVVLYRYISRERFFEILFYGYTIHVIITYNDSYLVRYGYVDHPYMVISQFPFSFSVNAAILPVVYMLLYQYCTDREKNFYLWSLAVSAFVGLLWLEVHKQLNLFQINEKMNILQLRNEFLNFYIFLGNYLVSIIVLWITKLFIFIKRNTKR